MKSHLRFYMPFPPRARRCSREALERRGEMLTRREAEFRRDRLHDFPFPEKLLCAVDAALQMEGVRRKSSGGLEGVENSSRR